MHLHLLLTFTLASAPAAAGTIKGTLKLAAPAQAQATVVYVEKISPERFSLPTTPQKLSQKGARFSPAVLPIVQNAEVDMTNDDWVTHSVFSKSEAKAFDLGLYAKKEKKSVVFEKSGRVDVYCSIHPKMHAVVLVLQNPFFAKPDENGAFTIENVPEGAYTLKVFQPEGPERAIEVKVPAKGEVTVAP